MTIFSKMTKRHDRARDAYETGDRQDGTTMHSSDSKGLKTKDWIDGHPMLLPYIAFVTTLLLIVEVVKW